MPFDSGMLLYYVVLFIRKIVRRRDAEPVEGGGKTDSPIAQLVRALH